MRNFPICIAAITVACTVSNLRAQWWPEIAGTTYYEYQSNGPIGRRTALDDRGGVYVIWMKSLS